MKKRSCAEMEHYAGLDVSLRATAVCVINERGRVIIEGKISVNRAQLPPFSNHTQQRSSWPASRRAGSHHICTTGWSNMEYRRFASRPYEGIC
jgi:hypothetical protein